MTLAAPALGTEHLLLGLAREDAGVAGRACWSASTRTTCVRCCPRAHPAPDAGAATRSAGGRSAALDAARRLADAREERAVGAEHLLAAVLGDPDCAAVAALERLGVDVGDLWSRAVAGLDRPAAVTALR